MKTKYTKIASIIEILLGLAMAGLGVFALLLSRAAPGPTAIVGFVLGVPMILLGILLIVFGINLGRLKKWAWLASVVISVIVIAFFVFLIIGFRAYSQPIPISLCVGAIICLALLVLGKIRILPAKKKIESLPKKISIPWKKILIIVVSILILILIAVIEVPKGMVTPVAEEPIQSKTASDCEKETSIERKDWCYKGVAQETKNSSLCGEISNKDMQNSCYAIATNDVSMCEKITNGLKMERCYAGVARETGDDSPCKKITDIDTKDGCYNEVAQKTKDGSLCEKITKSASLKDGCYFGVAVETKDSILCERIVATSGFASRDKCYDVIAVEIQDSGLCEKITNSVGKYVCYAIITNNVGMCEKVTGKHVGGGEQKELCYSHVAIEIKDASLCEKIIDTAKSSNMQDQCYANIARDTRDSSLCKKIIGRNPGSAWKDSCYLNTPCRSIAACVRKFLLGLKRALES